MSQCWLGSQCQWWRLVANISSTLVLDMCLSRNMPRNSAFTTIVYSVVIAGTVLASYITFAVASSVSHGQWWLTWLHKRVMQLSVSLSVYLAVSSTDVLLTGGIVILLLQWQCQNLGGDWSLSDGVFSITLTIESHLLIRWWICVKFKYLKLQRESFTAFSYVYYHTYWCLCFLFIQ